MIRRTVTFSGTVQGVGFRFTARSAAKQFPELTGYVKNLASGQVELVVEGEASDIDQLLADIDRRMAGYIKKRTHFDSPPTGQFNDFTIR